MFGYVTPDKPYLLIKDFTLYKCVYCGVCKSLKKYYGTMPRFTTNYDSVFLSILLHNYLNIDYNIKRQICVLSPLKKKGIAIPDDLSKKVISLNIILAYHKFTDDIIDGSKVYKRALRFVIVKRAYKKAKKYMPDADFIITQEYARLRELEKNGEKSLDRVSDCFAAMMQRLCKVLLCDKSCEQMEHFFYNIGKWIYIIDALDDLEKDKKSGNYNPLIAAYGNFEDVNIFKESIKGRLQFVFNCIFGSLKQDFEAMQFNFNTDLLRNILFRGLQNRTNTLVENIKCKKIRI